MVRTRRSIDEEARVRLVSGPGTDAFLSDRPIAGQMEGELLDELFTWGTEVARRALVVGLEDRGYIALELARRGIFVTVVEPDESLHEPVKAAAEAEHFMIRMNFYASDYMKREFASSGFDLAVFYSVLSRYNEPLVVLKKAARELRAGGRVFARIRVRPPMDGVNKLVAPVIKMIDKVPGAAGVRQKVADAFERLPGAVSVMALPESAELLEDIAGVFKIERHVQRHLIAPVVGWVGVQAAVPGFARNVVKRCLPAFVKADKLVVKAAGGRPIANHLYIFGLKELGLGHTFRV